MLKKTDNKLFKIQISDELFNIKEKLTDKDYMNYYIKLIKNKIT